MFPSAFFKYFHWILKWQYIVLAAAVGSHIISFLSLSAVFIMKSVGCKCLVIEEVLFFNFHLLSFFRRTEPHIIHTPSTQQQIHQPLCILFCFMLLQLIVDIKDSLVSQCKPIKLLFLF